LDVSFLSPAIPSFPKYVRTLTQRYYTTVSRFKFVPKCRLLESSLKETTL
jgi:hypothetical protein